MEKEPHTATLSCSGGETTFSFGNHAIRFRTPEKLKHYAGVRVWDKGYLVVDAQYDGMPSSIEEYIDLVPILENLHFDPEKFLEPIEEVRIV